MHASRREAVAAAAAAIATVPAAAPTRTQAQTQQNVERCSSCEGEAPNRHMAMTARSFISFFGREDESNAVSIKFTPQIKVPALVIHGTADEIALKPNAEAIYESLSAAPKRDLVWIEGARHYLTPGWIAETYAKRVAEWVAATMPGSPGQR